MILYYILEKMSLPFFVVFLTNLWTVKNDLYEFLSVNTFPHR